VGRYTESPRSRCRSDSPAAAPPTSSSTTTTGAVKRVEPTSPDDDRACEANCSFWDRRGSPTSGSTERESCLLTRTAPAANGPRTPPANAVRFPTASRPRAAASRAKQHSQAQPRGSGPSRSRRLDPRTETLACRPERASRRRWRRRPHPGRQGEPARLLRRALAIVEHAHEPDQLALAACRANYDKLTSDGLKLRRRRMSPRRRRYGSASVRVANADGRLGG